jgi:capsular polysaccharide export protein
MIRAVAVSGGFLGPGRLARRLRAILAADGILVRPGWPGPEVPVLAWGHAPRAGRAEWLAARTGAPLWRIEDAWLRSLRPARAGGEPPMGLLIDRSGGIHYDPSRPSDLETLLATHPLDDPALLARAELAVARLRHLHLSKYNAHDPDLAAPAPGFVLVVDQVRGDASIRHGGVDDRAFSALLARAVAENPGAEIVIRAHPEAAAGTRPGYFGAVGAGHGARDRVRLLTAPVSPWALLAGARAVYTVSSQLGFEAILAGHRPVVAGMPFYAGWGLSEDAGHPRRGRRLTAVQLAAAALILAPVWFDPLRGRRCELEEVIDQLEARVRAFRDDRAGWVATGMRAWKRAHVQAFFGAERGVRFVADPGRAAAAAAAGGRRLMGWASAVPADFAGVRVEDGLVRSRGLGAELVPPLGLMLDDLGIYYDPGRESRLERLIAGPLPPGALARAARLRAMIVAAGLTKYNLGGAGSRAGVEAIATRRAARPEAPVVLVPGQVEDDASVRLGGGTVRTNRDLLAAARAAYPDAILVWKPHPDVEAGLRPGAVPEAGALADLVAESADPAALLAVVDRVVTITSGLGFEALLRGVPVTVLGAPFYAGWGLTEDRGPVPARRRALPPAEALDRLVHAALIAAPRYRDPLTGAPCPPELALERLASGMTGIRPWRLRTLARLQGWLAGQAWLWR